MQSTGDQDLYRASPSPPDHTLTCLRLAAIVLLLLAWLPGTLLAFHVGSLSVGFAVGLPSAACFIAAFRRSGAGGNLIGAVLALATPLVWLLVGTSALALGGMTP
jgi:hypothetical protein